MKIFDFYFDESGNFEEHTFLEGVNVERTETPQSGASQLVGILATTGLITSETSEQILSIAHQKAGLVLERQCHATVLLKNGKQHQYATLLDEFLLQVGQSRVQSVRLSNNARIGFGDKVTTYTSMVAEMVVRIFEELTSKHGNDMIELNIIAARVRTNGRDKAAQPIFIDEMEYKRRLDEQIAFTAVRRGVAHNRVKWSIGSFRFGSGLKERPLQVCDLLSNASYHNFRNCSTEQKHKLKALFSNFDFTLNRSEVLEEIEHHRQEGSLAHAVQTIAENWNRPELDQNVRNRIKEHCASIVRQMADMPASARNVHLRQLAEWGGQFLVIRDLDLADTTLKWLENQIAEPLFKSVDDPVREDVCWFLAQLLILRLGEHNHRGELLIARPICDRLQEIFPALAGQWEHASLLTEAMTLRAVHLNDCYEFDEASSIMSAVEAFYGGLSSLMADALPGVFPERVRSRHRGMALGTQLQSEMFAGLSDPVRLENARRLNEMAIDEFSSENDQRRQYQYRCQIETYSGDLAAARSWLAKSLCVEADTHFALAERVKALDGVEQGFVLLHWSRIGMEAGRRGLKEDLNQFLEAFYQNGLDSSPWIKQQGQEYPAHGIRRHLAVVLGIAGRHKDCRDLMDKLSILDTKGKSALKLIQFAGFLEVASLWQSDRADSINMMLNNAGNKKVSLMQQLQTFAGDIASFQKIHDLVQQMLSGVNSYESSGFNDSRILKLACRQVGQ